MGCQWITGARERTFLGAHAPAGTTCRPSDCGDGGVCLDGACRVVCGSDADCDRGSRCLKTSLGAACVEPEAAACGDGDNRTPCPDGTACSGGQCRTVCSPISLPCLIVGQACRDSVCVGTDPLHDRGAADAGTRDGGLSGDGGASNGGNATTNGGSRATSSGGTTVTSSGGLATIGGTRATNSGGSATTSGGRGGTSSGGNATTGGTGTTSSGGSPTASGGTCSTGHCGAICSDGRRDGTETDVDCGGPDCPACDDGRRCTRGSDCAVLACNSCNGQCMPCTAGEACTCGNAPIAIDGACYVIHLRGGVVVESESSQQFCDPATPSIIPRPHDVTLIYVQSPPSQSVSMLSSVNPLPTWAALCTDTLQSRNDMLLAQLGTWGPSTTPDPDMFFLGVSTNCPVAALYRMQW